MYLDSVVLSVTVWCKTITTNSKCCDEKDISGEIKSLIQKQWVLTQLYILLYIMNYRVIDRRGQYDDL